MEEKDYTVNGKIYIQRPLKLKQLVDLVDALQGIEIADLSPLGIVHALGSRLPLAMAIVLIPEGTMLKEKDIKAIAEEFEEHLDIDTALAVAEDFFTFNPLSSISRKMKGMMIKMIEASAAILSVTASGVLSRTSAGEISPRGR